MPPSAHTHELTLLNAIFTFKADSKRMRVWVNAQDMAPILDWTDQATASLLRQLQMRGDLEYAPHDYDTSSNQVLQRYGLTPKGAQRAAYNDPMRLGYTELQGQVLVTMHFKDTRDGQRMVSASSLQAIFTEEDLPDLLRTLRSLASQGYLEPAAGSRGNAEEDLYRLTVPGHQVAAHYHREQRFPPPAAAGGGTTSASYHLYGDNSRVNHQSTDSSTNSVTHQTGLDASGFVEALTAVRAALQQLEDQEERELGELRLAQYQRAAEANQPVQGQWQRLVAWGVALPAAISGAAVVWDALAALATASGHPLPKAPEGLGQ